MHSDKELVRGHLKDEKGLKSVGTMVSRVLEPVKIITGSFKSL